VKVSTVGEMRDLDRIAIGRYGIPGEILMKNAGEAVYSVIPTEIGVQGHRFAVLCGGGHNGGDGLTALVANPGVIRARAQPTILTPGPGAMAAYRGSYAELTADACGVVRVI